MSPFSLARGSGYYGANRMFSNYVNRRLQLDSQEEKMAVKDVLL
jgi:hypothetical protein